MVTSPTADRARRRVTPPSLESAQADVDGTVTYFRRVDGRWRVGGATRAGLTLTYDKLLQLSQRLRFAYRGRQAHALGAADHVLRRGPARRLRRMDGKPPEADAIWDQGTFIVVDNDKGLQRLYINESLAKRLLKQLPVGQ